MDSNEKREFAKWCESFREIFGLDARVIMHPKTAEKIWTPDEIQALKDQGKLVTYEVRRS